MLNEEHDSLALLYGTQELLDESFISHLPPLNCTWVSPALDISYPTQESGWLVLPPTSDLDVTEPAVKGEVTGNTLLPQYEPEPQNDFSEYLCFSEEEQGYHMADIESSSASSSSVNVEAIPRQEDVAMNPVYSNSEKEHCQWEEVQFQFIGPNDRPKKLRVKGMKNSTAIACTFCRGRKIRCGGPQADKNGTCKSCLRLNKLECVFPTESFRGQRLKGSKSRSKGQGTTSISKNPKPSTSR